MALIGELVSLVLVPRFTTYVGADDFTSVAIDVSGFSGGLMIAWRGPLLGTSPSFVVYIEDSEDGIVWFALDSVDLSASASSPQSGQLDLSLTRRWIRVRVSLSPSDAAVTCWCSGSLERRVA